MFNRNTSLLAGAMTDDQLRDALAKAQQAYIDLATGSHGVSFSYIGGVSGTTGYILNSPTANITFAVGEIPVLGGVNFV